MKEFTNLTGKAKKEKAPEITNKHIKATRPTKSRKTKKTKRVNKEVVVNNTITKLTTKISANYQGKVDGIVAYINSLPEELQDMINSNDLKRVIARQGYSMYVLEGGITIKIKDEKLGKRNYLRLIVSHKKQQLFNNRV